MHPSRVLLACCLALALGACGTSTDSGTAASSVSDAPESPEVAALGSPSVVADRWATFGSDWQLGTVYSFQYPSSWRKQESPSDNSPVKLVLPRVPAFAKLSLDRVPPGTTLDALGRIARQNLAGQGFTVVETRPATMGGQPALVLEYERVKAMIVFKYARFLTVYDSYAYGLTYGATDKDFDANYPTAARMAESFTFGT